MAVFTVQTYVSAPNRSLYDLSTENGESSHMLAHSPPDSLKTPPVSQRDRRKAKLSTPCAKGVAHNIARELAQLVDVAPATHKQGPPVYCRPPTAMHRMKLALPARASLKSGIVYLDSVGQACWRYSRPGNLDLTFMIKAMSGADLDAKGRAAHRTTHMRYVKAWVKAGIIKPAGVKGEYDLVDFVRLNGGAQFWRERLANKRASTDTRKVHAEHKKRAATAGNACPKTEPKGSNSGNFVQQKQALAQNHRHKIQKPLAGVIGKLVDNLSARATPDRPVSVASPRPKLAVREQGRRPTVPQPTSALAGQQAPVPSPRQQPTRQVAPRPAPLTPVPNPRPQPTLQAVGRPATGRQVPVPSQVPPPTPEADSRSHLPTTRAERELLARIEARRARMTPAQLAEHERQAEQFAQACAQAPRINTTPAPHRAAAAMAAAKPAEAGPASTREIRDHFTQFHVPDLPVRVFDRDNFWLTLASFSLTSATWEGIAQRCIGAHYSKGRIRCYQHYLLKCARQAAGLTAQKAA